MQGTITVYDGTDVQVEHLEALPNGAGRFDVEADGKTWRIDVSRNGSVDVVTSWRDGQLDDVPLPGWIDDVGGNTARLRVVHASPDAPAVDVTAAGGEVVLFDGVSYGQSGYVEVEANDYTVVLRTTRSPALLEGGASASSEVIPTGVVQTRKL